MLPYELITDSELEQLPSDSSLKFTALEKLCRSRMLEAINHETSREFDALIRTEYMIIVATAAAELGIPNVNLINNFDSVQSNLEAFSENVSAAVTKIRLRKLGGKDGLSVRLANRTKAIIEHELTRLRAAVDDSDLSEEQKRLLRRRIEDFRTELHKERLSFAPAMATLAFIAATVAGTTAFLADAPNAVTTIIGLIGKDKQSEDAEISRLEGPKPVLSITDTTKPRKTSGHMDDDIPF